MIHFRVLKCIFYHTVIGKYNHKTEQWIIRIREGRLYFTVPTPKYNIANNMVYGQSQFLFYAKDLNLVSKENTKEQN